MFFFANCVSLVRAFKHILKNDRETYGDSADYTISDAPMDDFQQDVDDLIDATDKGTAVSAAAATVVAEGSGGTGGNMGEIPEPHPESSNATAA